MSKFRKKPIVIEAFQYDGDLSGVYGYYVPQWAIDAFESGIMYYDSEDEVSPPCELYIKTLEGNHHVSVNDYVIQGANGELYPCKPDIFAKTYEDATIEPSSWIPCAERVPDETDKYWVTFYYYGKVLVDERDYFAHEKYWGQGAKPIAWMPKEKKPEPWRGDHIVNANKMV